MSLEHQIKRLADSIEKLADSKNHVIKVTLKDINFQIGQRLKQIRESQCLTQEQFSLQFGMSQGELSKLESGQRIMSNSLAENIVENTLYKLDWLLTGVQR